jgi:hypothetical protein
VQSGTPSAAPRPGEPLRAALRALQALRDKTVVVAVGEEILRDPPAARAVAEQVGLLRAGGVRPVLVCGAAGPEGSRDALTLARTLVGALAAENERGLVLPALNVMSVHVLPAAVAAAAPLPAPSLVFADGRRGLPVVNPVSLVHLQALGYVPVLVPPVMDQDGAVVDAGARAVAAAVANALDAAALASLCPASGAEGTVEGLPPRTAWIELAPVAAGELLAQLLVPHPAP